VRVRIAWTRPLNTRAVVNAAGKSLVASNVSSNELDAALIVINNWRSSHSFPLNTIQTGLRKKARVLDKNCIVAQRIKRLSSISAKLLRFPSMKLAQMQDIGGCRAIVKDLTTVRALVNSYEKGQHKHKLAHVDDYIGTPQESGYRGAHLIYKYYSDRNDRYNDLKIEIQIRSPMQHAWATAVETVGTFIGQALKSSQGQDEWLRFFALMGSAIAIREGCPIVPDTPHDISKLRQEIMALSTGLNVFHRLQAYGMALKTLQEESARAARVHYYLLVLNPKKNELTVSGFAQADLEEASERYLEAEKNVKETPGSDAVLVSVDSLAALERAYPNYFADTTAFLQFTRDIVFRPLRRRTKK
jgi:hypothetical protein